MFEIVLLYGLIALVVASFGGMKWGNPFQVYFLVWSLIFAGYGSSRGTWADVDQSFWVMMLASHSIWALGLVLLRPHLVSVPALFDFNVRLVRLRVVLLLQVVCALALPFAYMKAVSLAGGGSLFEQGAYRGLRHELSYGEIGYGWGSYLIILSFLLTSVTVVLKANKKAGWLQLCVSVAVSLGFAFISTGRTYILLLAIVVIAPLFFLGKVGIRGVVASLAGLFMAFLLSAALTGKGASLDARFADNISDFAFNIRAYTIAPFVAFSKVASGPIEFAHGDYTFRFFIKFAEMLGWGRQSVVDLVREYEFVPDPTNVYTFFDPYFRDFGYLAIIASVPVMALHVWLYLRAASGKSGALFYYSISIYPLAMQFFQDQYASLLSTWAQVVFWLMLLVGPRLRLRREE